MKLKFIKRVLLVAVIGFVTNTSNAQSLTLSKIGGYSTGIYNAGGCEIVTYDAISQRLFSVNASTNSVDIISLVNPASPSLISSVNLGIYGASANSVSCKNGIVAIAVEDFVKTNNGKVVFMNTSGTILNSVTVGALPDMLTFTPDGLKVLVANEGEPNDAYTIDPVGSVSIIDISGGIAGIVQGNVTTLDFSAFNTPFVLDPSIRVYGPGATVAMDFEPEFITVSANSQTAWITLQENNAVVILDIPSATFTSVKGLGFKDHSIAGNGLDASDQSGVINIATWPVKGMYLPDGIASYVSGGNQYIVTANEGDTRAYTGFNEEARISTRTLDATAFPTGATLKLNTNLGRLGTSTVMGNTDADPELEELYSIGARSISIRDAAGNLVWDSGDKMEQVTAITNPANFNSSHTSNTLKNRSDDKGPEPEGVAIGKIGDSTYAFVGLERIGGVMVFNITNPATSYYVSYINSRNFAQTPGINQGGDLGVEGIIFVPASQSPNGKNLVITGNEISGTVAVFEVNLFPEINVLGNATSIVDGDASASLTDHTDFGKTSIGSSITRTFTISNTGLGALTVNSIALSGSASFSLVGLPTLPLTVASNGTQTFQVQFTPTTTGVFASTVAINNTDTDESTYDFVLSGTGLVAPVTGPSSSQSPYLVPSQPGVKTTSIITVGDAAPNGYVMCGIPDGTGAYDNGNGTFTLLVNHEIGATSGVVRAHGSTGAFVSKWIINKSNFSVVSGSDLITTVKLWNGSGYSNGTTQFSRFCSADLPAVSAFYNSSTGLGTQERIFMNGEETGAEGRAFANIVTGPNAGTTYQLPYLGRLSYENSVANSYMSNKTIVASTDDATPGQVYVYIGTKTNAGTEIDKAGLTNGKLYGITVTSLLNEVNATNLASAPFTMSDLGTVQNLTGAQLQTASVAAGITQFLRPEDIHWDPSNPSILYFVTTNSFTAPSKLWKVVFTDINNPELGGTISTLLDGSEGQKMLDNMTVDNYGNALLQEDVGNNAHNGKIHQYTVATDQLLTIAQHDVARFGDIGIPATAPFNQDEESSGIIDASSFLGAGNFLMVDQAHYTQPGQLVEGGQILVLFNPTTAASCLPTTSTTTVSNCGPYTWNGTTYTISGTYTKLLMNVQGCDSTATLILTIKNSSTSSTTLTSCDSLVWNGITYATSGTYTKTLVNAVGCDSIATLNLTINNSSTSSTTITACDSLVWNGTTYTTSGTYTKTLVNAVGCDSIATLNLTINNSSTSSTIITACDSYVWNAITYTTSGVYTFTATNAAGCDSIATLNLTINSIASYFVSAGSDQNVCANTNVSLNGSISGGVSNATWSTLGTGSFSPSANVLNATYVPSSTDYLNGSVALILTTNSVATCGSKSDTVVVTFIALPASPATLTGPTALCNPSTGALFTYTATPVVGATSYSWTVPAGVTIQGSATGSSITVKFNASAVVGGIGGSICVSANNANGCGNSTPTCLAISVQTNAPVQPNSISGPDKACPGDVAIYSVAPVSRATAYNWSIPANATIISGANTNVITLSFNAGFISGNLSVSASNVCGTSALRSRSIFKNTLAAPASISGVQFDGVCNATITYTASIAGASSYAWTLPTGATGSSTTNSITVTFTNTFTTGTISVAGVNNCGVGNSRSVTVKGAPGLPGVISGPTPICASSTNTYSIAVVQGASSYDWTVPTGVINFGQGTKTINMTYGSAVSPSGLITVKAINACGTSSTRILSVETLFCPRIGDATSTSGVSIYPNPANENVIIEFTADKAQNATITLRDATGRVVYNEAKEVSEGFNNAKINVNGFASGVYTLQLQSINGSQQFKVIVE